MIEIVFSEIFLESLLRTAATEVLTTTTLEVATTLAALLAEGLAFAIALEATTATTIVTMTVGLALEELRTQEQAPIENHGPGEMTMC